MFAFAVWDDEKQQLFVHETDLVKSHFIMLVVEMENLFSPPKSKLFLQVGS
jgi:hypothetical protein